MANFRNSKSKNTKNTKPVSSKNANLEREYEAHKDCTPEELEEYLKSLPPSERERYKEYAANVERKKKRAEQAKKEEKQNRLGCIIAIVVFAALIGAMAYFQDSQEETESKPKPAVTEEKESNGKASKSSATFTEENAGDASDKTKDAKAKQQKQAAFSKWTSATDKQVEIVEANWKILWEGALNAMSKGDAEKKKAKENIESFEKRLEESKQVFLKMEASKALTKDEQEKLLEANADYVVWVDERKEAAKEVKEIIDKDLTPEKLKQIEEGVKKSNANMKKIKSRIIEFQKGMGLISE